MEQPGRDAGLTDLDHDGLAKVLVLHRQPNVQILLMPLTVAGRLFIAGGRSHYEVGPLSSNTPHTERATRTQRLYHMANRR